jgi:hypothetical protein
LREAARHPPDLLDNAVVALGAGAGDAQFKEAVDLAAHRPIVVASRVVSGLSLASLQGPGSLQGA